MKHGSTLRTTVLQTTADPSKLPTNLNDPIPSIELGDITQLEDDYSFEGDEQMSMEGPNLSMDEQGDSMHMGAGVGGTSFQDEDSQNEIAETGQLDQHREMQNFPQRSRSDHVRRKSVIPLNDDVMRE